MKNIYKISLIIFFVVLVFTNCENANKKTTDDINEKVPQQDYLKKGKEMAMAAQTVLAKNLMAAINSGGTTGALSFCNVRALPLTDSTAVVLNAKIKRVSDRNRNVGNAANASELAYIQQAKLSVKDLGSEKPMLHEINNEMVGYYPIMTNGLCLKCHGDPSRDIDDATYSLIKDKYPNDKAIGYLANELRGIWVINMDK